MVAGPLGPTSCTGSRQNHEPSRFCTNAATTRTMRRLLALLLGDEVHDLEEHGVRGQAVAADPGLHAHRRDTEISRERLHGANHLDCSLENGLVGGRTHAARDYGARRARPLEPKD